MPARPELVDNGSAGSGCDRQSTRASSRCTRKTDAQGGYSLSEDDKHEHEERVSRVSLRWGGKVLRLQERLREVFQQTASGIASDNILKKPDAAWARVKDTENAKKCEYEEKRAAFHSARAAVKLLPSKICAWKIKDNISRLRLDVKGKLDACACEDWLEAIEAMNKLKYEQDESAEQSEQGDAAENKVWVGARAPPKFAFVCCLRFVCNSPFCETSSLTDSLTTHRTGVRLCTSCFF